MGLRFEYFQVISVLTMNGLATVNGEKEQEFNRDGLYYCACKVCPIWMINEIS